jgi:hypothetical protein
MYRSVLLANIELGKIVTLDDSLYLVDVVLCLSRVLAEVIRCSVRTAALAHRVLMVIVI